MRRYVPSPESHHKMHRQTLCQRVPRCEYLMKHQLGGFSAWMISSRVLASKSHPRDAPTRPRGSGEAGQPAFLGLQGWRLGSHSSLPHS